MQYLLYRVWLQFYCLIPETNLIAHKRKGEKLIMNAGAQPTFHYFYITRFITLNEIICQATKFTESLVIQNINM